MESLRGVSAKVLYHLRSIKIVILFGLLLCILVETKFLKILKRVSWIKLTTGVSKLLKSMRQKVKQEEVAKVRLNNLKNDLEMVEAKQKRLDEDKARLIMKLVSTRETLLALKEQDE